jgi:hypothetical protein
MAQPSFKRSRKIVEQRIAERRPIISPRLRRRQQRDIDGRQRGGADLLNPFANAAAHNAANMLIGPEAQPAVRPLPLDGAGNCGFAMNANTCNTVKPNCVATCAIVGSILQSWRRYLREFGGLAKVDRIGGYAAKFSRSISIA